MTLHINCHAKVRRVYIGCGLAMVCAREKLNRKRWATVGMLDAGPNFCEFGYGNAKERG